LINEKKSGVIIALLIIGIFVLSILSASLYLINRQENENTINKEVYFAAIQMRYAVESAYDMHVNYTHMNGTFTQEDMFNMSRDRQVVISLLNFSVSTLEDARKRCDSIGWSHKGLDNNIMAYKKLRNFLLLNWGNTTEVIPVTKYIKNHLEDIIFQSPDELEYSLIYNYDADSKVIEEGLKHAP